MSRPVARLALLLAGRVLVVMRLGPAHLNDTQGRALHQRSFPVNQPLPPSAWCDDGMPLACGRVAWTLQAGALAALGVGAAG